MNVKDVMHVVEQCITVSLIVSVSGYGQSECLLYNLLFCTEINSVFYFSGIISNYLYYVINIKKND